MPEQIIVPVDASAAPRRALAVAHTLARQLDAEVIALVVEGATSSAGRLEPWGIAASVGCELTAVEVVAESDIVDALVAVTHAPARLLCLGTHGRPRGGRAPFGRVTPRVLHAAGGPVLLVGPQVPDQPPLSYQNLVVGCPSDGHGVSGTGEVRLLTDAGLQPWLVEVLPPQRAEFDADLPASGLARRIARDLTGNERANWEVVRDRSVVRGLVGFARDLGDSIVLVGTHGRLGPAAFVHRDVALCLSHRATAPVLAVPATAVAGEVTVRTPRIAHFDVRLDLDRVPRAALPQA